MTNLDKTREAYKALGLDWHVIAPSNHQRGFMVGYQAATAAAEAKYLPVIEKAMQRIEEALPYVFDSRTRATLHMMKAELAAPLLRRE